MKTKPKKLARALAAEKPRKRSSNPEATRKRIYRESKQGPDLLTVLLSLPSAPTVTLSARNGFVYATVGNSLGWVRASGPTAPDAIRELARALAATGAS